MSRVQPRASPRGRRTAPSPRWYRSPRAEQDAFVTADQARLVAADHDHQAVGPGRPSRPDRAEEQPRQLTGATRSRHQG
jgi:hypothetical protein